MYCMNTFLLKGLKNSKIENIPGFLITLLINLQSLPVSLVYLFIFLLLIYLSMKLCLNMCAHIYICTSICIYIHTFIHTHVTQICYLKDMNTIMLCLCLVTCFLHTSNVLELFPHTGLSHSL